jgi:hypothetical protein
MKLARDSIKDVLRVFCDIKLCEVFKSARKYNPCHILSVQSNTQIIKHAKMIKYATT